MTLKTKTLVGVALALSLPLAATAQSSDATYCKALSDKYQRYVGTGDVKHNGPAPDASVDNAITRCQSEAARSIPVIEKALKNAKVDLPPRT